MTSQYGSSKESSSGSSYLSSSGSSYPSSSAGSSQSSSNCSCLFLAEITPLSSAASAEITITNLSNCTHEILSFTYLISENHLSITAASPTLPHPLAPNEFATFYLEEDFDIQGMEVVMETSCDILTFQLPFLD